MTTLAPTPHDRPHRVKLIDPQDPYQLDDTAFTREEILLARGMPCRRTRPHRTQRRSATSHD
jgi:hypothetical protein